MQLPVETEALVVNTPGGDFEMTRIVIQDLRSDEVLVEMKYSGVCHTVCISHTPWPSCLAAVTLAYRLPI